MRILGLDVGDKTIGVAVSDPLGWTAQGIETIKRDQNIENDLNRLAQIIEQYQVEQIILGLPKNMDGSLGPQAQKILQFQTVLKERFAIPVDTWDERMSTVSAERVMLEADMSRRKRKKKIDTVAATIILQNYLESQRRYDSSTAVGKDLGEKSIDEVNQYTKGVILNDTRRQ